MARIAGVDLPRDKRLEVGLTYIFGVGCSLARETCDTLKIDRDTKIRDLTASTSTRISASRAISGVR
jgi:small subunit ribosomal protein S13